MENEKFKISENFEVTYEKAEKIEKWFEIKLEIFKEKPLEFKNKILNLKINNNTSCRQQPCET